MVPAGTIVPSGPKASTAQPSSRHEISPARTGTRGDEPTKAVQTSVPPLMELTGTPSSSCTQRNPSGGSGAPVEPTQRKRAALRVQARLAAGEQERGRRAEHGQLGVGGERPERVEVGVAGVAVEEDDRGPDEQAGDQVVPHHPAGGGEPREPVVRGQVLVEREHLQVLERDPAVAVHDGLRQARRARAEQHVERVIERDRLERQRPGRRSGQEIGPGDAIGDALGEVRDRHHSRMLGISARIAATSSTRPIALLPYR